MNTLFEQKRTKETKIEVVSSTRSFVPFVSFCATPSEREIDERVYRLYALTLDEIKLVEEAAAK